MEFYSSKDIKKTRKVHRCHLCCLEIPIGASCFYEAGKYDLDFFSRHSHHECAAKWLEMNKDECGSDWVAFESMPVAALYEWQSRISKVYGVSDGEEL